MKKMGIIVAMSTEFDMVANLMESKVEKSINGKVFAEGIIGDKDVILTKSGIGKVNAACSVVEMISNYHPEYIINTGIAGGIDVKTQIMDVVVGQQMVYHDVWCGEGNEYGQVQDLPTKFKSDNHLYKTAISLDSEINIYGGLICSGDKFITDKKELEDIKSKFADGLAVDMESASMAQVCYLYNIPFLSLRIISDTPGVKDHWEQYSNFWDKAPEKSAEVIRKLLKNI